MKDVLKLLAKSVLIPLGLTAAVSAIDATVQKKILKIGSAVRPLNLAKRITLTI